MASLKKLAGQTAIYGLSSIVGRILNYLLVPIYTRVLAPSEYGVATEIYAYIAFLLVMLTFGMETGFFRFAQIEGSYKKVYTNAIYSVFVSSALFIGLGLLFTPQLAAILEYPLHPEYVRWFIIIVALDAFSCIPFAKLRQQNRPIRFVTFKLLNIGLNIGFNLYFLVLCPYLAKHFPENILLQTYDASIGVGYIFISNLISSIVTLLFLIPDIFDIDFTFYRPLFKKMILYSFPLMFAQLAGVTNDFVDRILLKHLIVPPEGTLNAHDYIMGQIGIYGANAKVAILMTLFIQTFRYAAEPFFFSHDDSGDKKQLYGRVMKYFVLFGLFIFLGIMMYIDIIKYFIDVEYHEGVKVVPLLMFSLLCNGILFNLSFWYKLSDMTKYALYISLCGAALTIAFNFLLIPRMGYMGAAWTFLISHMAMVFMSYFLSRKFNPIAYETKRILSYIVFALLLFFISKMIPDFGLFAKYGTNTVLLGIFAVIVFKKEKIYSLIKK